MGFGDRGGGGGFRGRGGGGGGGFRGRGGGDRGRGGFRGGRGGGGFNRGYDQGPPDTVVELGTMKHTCEDDLVCKCTNEKVPYFNAPIFLENKQQVGKVDEIFGPVRDFYFSIKLSENMKAGSFSKDQKLLPLQRFLEQPKRGGRGGGRGGGGRGGGGRGGGGRGGGFRGGRGGGGRGGGFGGGRGGGFGGGRGGGRGGGFGGGRGGGRGGGFKKF